MHILIRINHVFFFNGYKKKRGKYLLYWYIASRCRVTALRFEYLLYEADFISRVIPPSSRLFFCFPPSFFFKNSGHICYQRSSDVNRSSYLRKIMFISIKFGIYSSGDNLQILRGSTNWRDRGF